MEINKIACTWKQTLKLTNTDGMSYAKDNKVAREENGWYNTEVINRTEVEVNGMKSKKKE